MNDYIMHFVWHGIENNKFISYRNVDLVLISQFWIILIGFVHRDSYLTEKNPAMYCITEAVYVSNLLKLLLLVTHKCK